MGKKEIIERYGEQYYKDALRRHKDIMRMRAMGLMPKVGPVRNDITLKIKWKAMDAKLQDRLECQEKIAAALQKTLQKWWRHQTDKKFILIVEYKNNINGFMKYNIDLSQLNLQSDEIKTFKEGAEKIVKEYLANLEVDN